MADDFELLEKTELRVENIGLAGANLSEVAMQVATVLGLDEEEVFVIDAHDDVLTLDILRTTINSDMLVGRDKALLAALARVRGVEVDETTRFCSEGVLGWIVADREDGLKAVAKGKAMARAIQANIAKRVIVFSTGPEVVSGQIEDTNTPTIAKAMTACGYRVTPGGALPDDMDIIASNLREAVLDRGFGIVITTGGVGAEAKDKSVEALERCDSDAATPYLAKFEKGRGRHAKDGIRIGVGELSGALLCALPGPNDEVKIAIEHLLEGLQQAWSKSEIAEAITAPLRARFRQKRLAHA